MRWGLIGCGGIGALRAAALRRAPAGRLVAVSDLDQARARQLARSTAVVASSWESMIQRDDLDGVIVSTPPHLHAEMAVAALQSGKHVLSEKPLARTPADALRMVQAAESAERLLATGFNYRFYPSVRKARELFDSGIIGELDHVRSYAGYSATEHNPPWVHDADVMGGGALRDNGIHLIDLTSYFLGEAQEVSGFASGGVWRFPGCEDNGFVLLRTAAGKIASVQASWTEWRGYQLLVEIYGTLGCIRTWCFPMRTQVVWSAELGGKTKRKTHYFPWTMVQEHARSYREIVVQSFVQEFAAFESALRGEKTALASGRDGLRAIEIAHAVAHAPEQRASREVQPELAHR